MKAKKQFLKVLLTLLILCIAELIFTNSFNLISKGYTVSTGSGTTNIMANATELFTARANASIKGIPIMEIIKLDDKDYKKMTKTEISDEFSSKKISKAYISKFNFNDLGTVGNGFVIHFVDDGIIKHRVTFLISEKGGNVFDKNGEISKEAGNVYEYNNCIPLVYCPYCSKVMQSGNTNHTVPSGKNCTETNACAICKDVDFSLSGHIFVQNPTDCTQPFTCANSNCSATSPGYSSHAFATTYDCTATSTCTRCTATESGYSSHTWKATDCTKAPTCSNVARSNVGAHKIICQVEFPGTWKALSHNWVRYEPDDCTSGRYCSNNPIQKDGYEIICAETTGPEFLSHNYVYGDCTKYGTCSNSDCKSTDATYYKGSHNFVYTSCLLPGKCTNEKCNIEDTTHIQEAHVWQDYTFDTEDGLYTCTISKCSNCLALGVTTLNPAMETSIVKYNGTDESVNNVEVPRKINVNVNGSEVELTVVQIKDAAFENKTFILQVIIPMSIKTDGMGSNVFNGCNNLSTIICPKDVVLNEDNIEEKSIDILKYGIASSKVEVDRKYPEEVLGYGIYGYIANAKQDTYVEIPEKMYGCYITHIENEAFKNSQNIIDITVTETNKINYVGSSAFENCTKLQYTIIPKNITSIKEATYKGCTSLAEITIPNTITNIENSAFEGCVSIEYVTLPSRLKEMGNATFKNCTGLNRVTIPKGVTTLGTNTFEGCTSLIELTIPNTVLSIGDNVFLHCESLDYVGMLQDITIPASSSYKLGIQTIGENAFENTKLEYVVVPRSVNTIKKGAFTDNTVLEEAYIPSSVTTIEDGAFGNNSSNLVIYCEENSVAYQYAKANGITTKFMTGIESVVYEPYTKTNSSVRVTITATEPIKKPNADWSYANEEKTIVTKEYDSNITEYIDVEVLNQGGSTGEYTISANPITIYIDNIDDGEGPTLVSMRKDPDTDFDINGDIKVTIVGSEEMQAPDGWTLEDAYTISKVYTENANETVTLKDTVGNVGETVPVIINNIDKLPLDAVVEYTPSEDTHDKVQVKIKANKKIKGVLGWILDEDKMTLTRTLPYDENGTEQVEITDYIGNTKQINIEVNNIYAECDFEEETCTKPETCRICGKKRKNIDPSKHPQNAIITKITKYATNLAEGEIATFCTACQKTISIQYYGPLISPETCTHEAGYTKITTPATCTEDGKEEYICIKCGARDANTEPTILPKLGHDFQPATCIQKEKCSRCDATQGEINPENHDYARYYIVTKEPTETEEGEQKEYCLGCKKLLATKPIAPTGPNIPEHEHDMQSTVIIFPTCTENGQSDYRCTYCGFNDNNKYLGIIKALGHDIKDATCVEPTRCTRCDYKEIGVNPSNHPSESIVSDVIKYATTEEKGKIIVRCTACTKTIEEKEYGPIDKDCEHTYEWTMTQSPLCEDEGKREAMCIKCGYIDESQGSQSIAPTGHDYYEATCVNEKVCKKCGKVDGEKNPHNHPQESIEVRTIKEATDTKKGVKGKFCAACNSEDPIETWEYGPKVQENHTHEFYWEQTKAPTCMQVGERIHVCDCGYIETTEEVPYLDHLWQSATCLEPAKCVRCPVIKGEALGHLLNEGTCVDTKKCVRCRYDTGELNKDNHPESAIKPRVRIQATTKQAGEKINHCTACGNDIGEPWPYGPLDDPSACNHEYEYIVKAATCILDGEEKYVCKKCDEEDTSKRKTLPALGHDFKGATCTEYGVCTRCNKQGELAPDNHPAYAIQEVTEKLATTTSQGIKKKVCTACSAQVGDKWTYGPLEEITDCDHTYTYFTTQAATCTRYGIAKYVCTKCGYEDESKLKISPLLEHVYRGANCTTEGVCVVCNAKGDIEPDNHPTDAIEERILTLATKESVGTMAKFCRNCNKQVGDIEEYGPLGDAEGCAHNWRYITTSQATCILPGCKEYMCIKCGTTDESKKQEIPALGHAYQKATCIEKEICIRCSGEQGEVNPENHIEECIEIRTTKPATETETGTKIKFCTACKKQVGDSWEYGPLNQPEEHEHNYKWEQIKAPTCTETGLMQYVCSCGKEFEDTEEEDKIVDALGHKFLKATCMVEGKCTRCGLKNEDINPNNHSNYGMKEGNIITQPTSTTEGLQEMICNRCEKLVAYKVLPKTTDPDDPEHTHTCEWTTTEEATCIKTGIQKYICTGENCNYIDEAAGTKTIEIDPNNHAYAKYKEVTENGQIIIRCSGCNKVVEGPFNPIGPDDPTHTEHKRDTIITKKPTCTEKGEKDYQCIYCGDNENGAHKEEIPIDPNNHPNTPQTTEERVIKEASTTQKGIMGKYCTKCNSQTPIKTWEYGPTKPSHSHTFKWITREGATCAKTGIRKYMCTDVNCGYIDETAGIQTIEIDPNNHAYVRYKDIAENGQIIIRCSGCNKVLEGPFDPLKPTDPHTHVMETIITKKPTCIEKGEKDYQCIYCEYNEDGKHKEELPIDANNHAYAKYKEVTENGQIIIRCSGCNKVVEGPFDPIGPDDPDYPTHKHVMDTIITKKPTCIEKGEKDYQCIYCGDNEDGVHKEEIPIDPNNHPQDAIITKITTEATTTTVGKLTTMCMACQKTLNEEEYGPLTPDTPDIPCEHTYIWTTTEATCTEQGKKKHMCTKCGKVDQTETIEALGHTFEPATCTTPKTCSRCLATEGDVDSTNHASYGEYYVITKNPTATENGEREVYCKGCKKLLRTETIDKENNKDDDNKDEDNKQEDNKQEDNKQEDNKQEDNKQDNNKQEDNTTANNKIPQTGISIFIIIVIISISVFGTVRFVQYKKMK